MKDNTQKKHNMSMAAENQDFQNFHSMSFQTIQQKNRNHKMTEKGFSSLFLLLYSLTFVIFFDNQLFIRNVTT